MEDEPDPIICGCGAEPGNAKATPDELRQEGWNPEGEFGPQCPECVANEPPASEAVDFVEAINEVTEEVKKKTATKKRKPRKKKEKAS